jgi:hypothetical protein
VVVMEKFNGHTELPWSMKIIEEWPYNIKVPEINLFHARFAYSTKSKTYLDVMSGVGMGDDADEALEKNLEQDNNIEFIIEACNSYYDLKARNAELVECLKLFTKTVNYTENEYDVLQTKALKLIEKNEG